MWRLVPSSNPDNSERGAAGVIVALMMLVLIGAGAIAVDVGQIYSERAQLQNGADSAALAVAQSCVEGPCNTSLVGSSSLAGPLADANANDGHSEVTKIDISIQGQVTVSTATKNGSSSFLTQLFSSALNAGPVTVGASSTASWGGPGAGPSALPITFAPCQFDVDGGVRTILTHGSETCVSDSPSGAVIPGGFAWLTPTGGCSTTVFPDDTSTSGVIDPYAMTSTGLNFPNACKTLIPGMLNTVVLLPVFSTAAGVGINAKYYIKGFAAFKLLGYRFPGASGGDLTGLGGSNNGIRGQFVSWVADPTSFTGSGYSDGGVSLPPHLIK